MYGFTTYIFDFFYPAFRLLIENLIGATNGIVRIKASPRYVWSVKIADRVSNLKCFPALWSRKKVANYLDEAAMIAHELGGSSEGLHARLVSRIADARIMLSLMQ